MEPIMNKKILKYKCFAFLFAVSLIIVPITSFAGDAVKQIKLAELNTLLESSKGKVVILDLWATWCPPCRKGVPIRRHLSSKMSPLTIEFTCPKQKAEKLFIN